MRSRNSEAEGEVPITQDQRHTVRGQLRYTMNDRFWLAERVRYGSGLPVELEGEVDKEELEAQFGADTVAQVDFESGRVRSNLALDLGAGVEPLAQWSQRRLNAARRGGERHQSPERDQLRGAVLGDGARCAAQRDRQACSCSSDSDCRRRRASRDATRRRIGCRSR